MKARLIAYAAYQVRDFFAGRALAIVLVTALVAWGYATTHGLTPAVFDAAAGVDARDQLERAVELVVLTFAFVAAAAAAQGLVARHRSRGYDRVLFSRRLNPARYYVQGFALAGAGSVLVATLVSELYAVTVHPISVAGVAGLVALAWMTIGGLAFLLSVLTPLHAPLLAALVAADLLLDRYTGAMSAPTVSRAVMSGLRYALPPAHVIAGLRAALVRGFAVDPGVLVWPTGFGVVCVVLALVLLRRRPVGS